jgi:surface antigen
MSINHKILALLVLVLLSFVLISCEGYRAGVGGFGGAAAGGFLGHALGGGAAGVIGGAIAGGLIGGAIGDRMDAADRRESERAAQQAFETAPSGQSTGWSNPDSGNHGTITPTRTFQSGNNEYCREFQQTVVIGGEEEQAHGTACRQANGSWRIVS